MLRQIRLRRIARDELGSAVLEGDAGEWLTVTTTVDDPRYLNVPFVTSSSFRREADGSKFKPVPCRAGS